MKKKLNLTVDPELIERAKKICERERKSLSQIFEELLRPYCEENGVTSWLDDFHKKYEDSLNTLTPEQEEKLKQKRGEKWQ